MDLNIRGLHQRKYALNIATVSIISAITGANVSAPVFAATPQIFNLGNFPGQTGSQGLAVNSNGQVAGGVGGGFLFSGGTLYALGALDGRGSIARGINASGQVVGQSSSASGNVAFIYNGIPGHGGKMTNLGKLSNSNGGSASAYAINDNAEVVGASSIPISFDTHAFLYTGTSGSGGSMIDLGTIGGNFSNATAINASGEIVGITQIANNGQEHAFAYVGAPGNGGHMFDLGTLGGTMSSADGINAKGQITGFSFTTGTTDDHAFLYSGTPGQSGTMTDLGTLGGLSSEGWGINSRGVVVGQSDIPSAGGDHAFIYTNVPGNGGPLIDLNTWLAANNPAAASQWNLLTALSISDNGWVSGCGIYNGVAQAYLLDASTLVPEPGSLSLVLIGAPAWLGRRARRRIPLGEKS